MAARASGTTPRATLGDEVFVRRDKRLRRSHRKAGKIDAPATTPEAAARNDEETRARVIRAHQSMQTVFQPIVDLRSGQPVGAEALARFDVLPARTPDVWFAEATSVGLGVQLEVAALHSALEQLHRIPAGIYLSLNASPLAMASPELRQAMTRIPAERVVLELTEHTGIDDYQLFAATIQDLRSSGARLAVDDAGAGFASFRHILNLRPDVIKLDIGLTRGIDVDPARRALGTALLNFGFDAYRATMVAEGIETQGEFNTLRSLGCRFGQGFFLGRPGRLAAPRGV
jgi:EAL domain-containing protein (putative c-di-GMP-specific phosphodiesterase class I)